MSVIISDCAASVLMLKKKYLKTRRVMNFPAGWVRAARPLQLKYERRASDLDFHLINETTAAGYS